ncbi:glycosyltransferase family 4 protein [Aetokthonos hydrillicola Thurmond2011]|jgi:glycosyltransferase involved in cell wall biosynthesis|uniref:Glycosyltransferase family 4 protein n=1 Tax=Aetokthonos hydrillicola Thurmond2011 TaxID=2712845 RepID=A0AAP5I4M9_9CYAN|nr:glycosyltransferase family 4 protein [Aetokthonos hydrillicola]MBO3457602.1 glycosyltransferase [Aetokthonos hydrillicola CCALA 1050]MBW4587880.1 glycosyltransferase family 4 protein [Aetokthonos hydrillicola CCALA 1050]MDR9894716.1 glycosyltransferase family 4 protein [Aetokthonos hydrillicola Thurmond2011]
MKVLHLSTYDLVGGASRSSYRLHQGLKKIGVTSQMLVQSKHSDDKTVIATEPKSGVKRAIAKSKALVNDLPLKLYPQRNSPMFSAQLFPDAIARKISKIAPDIINLHWVCNGYLQIETLSKFEQPIVWTLQDMWAFTGGCHYTQECDRYTTSCGACPQLESSKNRDLSYKVWQRKLKAWNNLNITVVTPTQWLAECARASSIFRDHRVEVIPFCLDTNTYKPVDRQLARELLKLPQDKQLVLFGAISATSDRRKGFHLLQAALQKLSQTSSKEKLNVVVFGASQPENPVNLGFESHYLGHLYDDISLALTYSAADVMIVPSIQEAFGQTASESLACGTPVIAFNATGLKDIVDHQENGYLVKPYETDDFAQGIAWVLEDTERHQKLCESARQKAIRKFALKLQARHYQSLYADILNGITYEEKYRNL